jgi:transcriptional regulator with XRE-family HTH domain
MEILANKLKKRAEELGLSNAEVARRVELSERRYAHYASGRNEPDLALLVKIAGVLQLTPNDLLGVSSTKTTADNRSLLQDRLNAASHVMTEQDLEAAVAQAEAVIAIRRK